VQCNSNWNFTLFGQNTSWRRNHLTRSFCCKHVEFQVTFVPICSYINNWGVSLSTRPFCGASSVKRLLHHSVYASAGVTVGTRRRRSMTNVCRVLGVMYSTNIIPPSILFVLCSQNSPHDLVWLPLLKKACWPYPWTKVDFKPKFIRTGRDRK